MSRMSARFVGRAVGMSTKWVYGMWKDMGLVVKDKFGDWALTAAGHNICLLYTSPSPRDA